MARSLIVDAMNKRGEQQAKDDADLLKATQTKKVHELTAPFLMASAAEEERKAKAEAAQAEATKAAAATPAPAVDLPRQPVSGASEASGLDTGGILESTLGQVAGDPAIPQALPGQRIVGSITRGRQGFLPTGGKFGLLSAIAQGGAKIAGKPNLFTMPFESTSFQVLEDTQFIQDNAKAVSNSLAIARQSGQNPRALINTLRDLTQTEMAPGTLKKIMRQANLNIQQAESAFLGGLPARATATMDTFGGKLTFTQAMEYERVLARRSTNPRYNTSDPWADVNRVMDDFGMGQTVEQRLGILREEDLNLRMDKTRFEMRTLEQQKEAAARAAGQVRSEADRGRNSPDLYAQDPNRRINNLLLAANNIESGGGSAAQLNALLESDSARPSRENTIAMISSAINTDGSLNPQGSYALASLAKEIASNGYALMLTGPFDNPGRTPGTFDFSGTGVPATSAPLFENKYTVSELPMELLAQKMEGAAGIRGQNTFGDIAFLENSGIGVMISTDDLFEIEKKTGEVTLHRDRLKALSRKLSEHGDLKDEQVTAILEESRGKPVMFTINEVMSNHLMAPTGRELQFIMRSQRDLGEEFQFDISPKVASFERRALGPLPMAKLFPEEAPEPTEAASRRFGRLIGAEGPRVVREGLETAAKGAAKVVATPGTFSTGLIEGRVETLRKSGAISDAEAERIVNEARDRQKRFESVLGLGE